MKYESFSKADFHLFIQAIIFGGCFILPLIIANYEYRDDVVRAVTGYPGWSMMGRPLADYLFKFVLAPGGAVYPSVLLLLLSLVCISVSCVFIKKSLKITGGILSYLSVLIIFFNPFLLQNYSYQYDSLPMSLGMCFATIAASLNDKKWFLLAKCVLLSSAAAFYQPCINMFIGIFAFKIFLMLKDNKLLCMICYSIFKNVIVFSVSCIIYYFVWYVWFAEGHRDSINGGLITNLLENNVYAFDHYIKPFLDKRMLVFILIPACFSIFSISNLIRNNHFSYKKNGIILFLCFVALVFSLLGPFAFLSERPAGVRVILTIGIIVCFILHLIDNLNMKMGVKFLIITPMLFLFFSKSFYYGAFLIKQKEYENAVLQHIVQQDILTKFDEIFFYGSLGLSPSAKVIVKENPYIIALFGASENWIMKRKAYDIGLFNINKDWEGAYEDFCKNNCSLFYSNASYNIYSKFPYAAVVLKEK